LEAAAGCPQIAKLLLSFQHRRIPASLHSAELNPNIDFKGLNLEVVREARDWPSGRPLAAINSFGFGGANAHAILSSPEALPEVVRPMPVGALTPARPVLGFLSARSEASLRALAQAHLEAEPQDLADTAFTAAKHR